MGQSSGIGKNLVFIHGSGCNKALWAYQSRYFSQRHNVLAIDLPGHGLDKGSGLRSVDAYAQHVLSLIRQRSMRSPILIGHSLGGGIALRAALDSPEEIGGIALVGTGARLRVAPGLLTSIKSDFASALAFIGEYAFSPKTPRELVEKALREMGKASPDVLYGDFAACDRFDVMQEISGIRLPTAIIVGRDDRLTPIKYSEYLNKNISGSRIEIIDDAGHMVMLEQPAAFGDALERFIDASGR